LKIFLEKCLEESFQKTQLSNIKPWTKSSKKLPEIFQKSSQINQNFLILKNEQKAPKKLPETSQKKLPKITNFYYKTMDKKLPKISEKSFQKSFKKLILRH
jgi:hypothetical protein